MFGSVLLRREGVRGFGFGIGCLGVIQMARDGRRQVGVGRIGVGTVTVVTVASLKFTLKLLLLFSPFRVVGPGVRAAWVGFYSAEKHLSLGHYSVVQVSRLVEDPGHHCALPQWWGSALSALEPEIGLGLGGLFFVV